MADNVTSLKRAETPELKVPGCGRDANYEKALCFYFSRRVTDNELRFLHEVMQRAVTCMPKTLGELGDGHACKT